MDQPLMALRLRQASNQAPGGTDWQVLLQQAEVFVQSGLLPKEIKTAQAALLIMCKGREVGIPPVYALSNIAVVNGKPVCSAELMLALIYRDQGDDGLRIVETDAEHCTLAYKRHGWAQAVRFTFDLEDAERAGLLNNPTWQKYPQAMLRARAISAVARLAFPDSIAGMYTPDELGATVTVDAATGEVQVDRAPAGEEIGHFQEAPARAAGAAPAPAPATPDQLAQIARLAPAAGISMEEVVASLRLGALEDLTAAKAERVIARLQEKAAAGPPRRPEIGGPPAAATPPAEIVTAGMTRVDPLTGEMDPEWDALDRAPVTAEQAKRCNALMAQLSMKRDTRLLWLQETFPHSPIRELRDLTSAQADAAIHQLEVLTSLASPVEATP